MPNQALMSSKKHDWRTPQDLFDFVAAPLELRTDLAASKRNALLPSYLTERDNALEQSWRPLSPTWANPPFGRALPGWIQKHAEEALEGTRMCLHMPARPDTDAWHSYILAPHPPFHLPTVIWIRGRITYRGAPSPAPFPSCFVLWGWSSFDLVRRFSAARARAKVQAKQQAKAKAQAKRRQACRQDEPRWILRPQSGRFWTAERII